MSDDRPDPYSPQQGNDPRGQQPTGTADDTHAFARDDLYAHPGGQAPENPSAQPAETGAPPAYGAPWGAPPPVPAQRSGRRVGTGVLLAALVLGGFGGVAGSAAFDAYGPAGNDGGVSTSVVDSGRTAATPTSVQGVASTVLPSVVQITVSSAGQQGSGSGIVLSSDGTILTNDHVVEGAGAGGELVVSFNDGTTAPATVLGEDPLTDIAVIKVDGVDGLVPATLGKSGNLAVGQNVVAVGSPFGLSSTVTTGIVSALDRPVSVGQVSPASQQSAVYPAIQTDAAINPGNSGGPLVNLEGQVVGINASIRTSSDSTMGSGQSGSIGLGFAIPIDEVAPIIDQIRNGEAPTHARIGISVSDATGTDGLPRGAQVETVEAGTAGADAGLKTGDVVTELNGEQVTSSDALVALIRSLRPGDDVTLTVSRGGGTQELKATLMSDAASTQS